VSANELDALLAGEIARRLPLLATDGVLEGDRRAALHSLRGAAGMAGHTELALVLSQLSARLRAGDEEALAEIRELLEYVRERLERGLSPFDTRWPVPPPGLAASSVDARHRGEYLAAARDRLGELDSALASTRDPVASLEAAQRSVHALKGASAAVGDDVVAWYCHGLESRLKELPREVRQASDALVDLARHRALLTLLVEDPARGLEMLRALPEEPAPPRASSEAPRPPRRKTQPPSRPPLSEVPAEPNELRIAERSVERFLEKLERLDGMHDTLASSSDVARRMALRLREHRLALLEALRRIGPARPWGPPASAVQQIELTAEGLRRAAARAERGARTFKSDAGSLRARVTEMRNELYSLRRTQVSSLFDLVARASARFAETEGKLVRVVTSGGDVSVDRRVAERLLDPVVQLVRNAVAHGIGTPDKRREAGRDPVGTIWLSAERVGVWLRVVVEDDGRGADLVRIRELAIARGILSPEVASRTEDADPLLLLFAPGLSTAEGADLLAGRGIGLDLVQNAVRRLGGTISLKNRPGGGLSATLDVPLDQKVIDVLWIEEAGREYALPVGFSGRVLPVAPGAAPQRLCECLGLEASGPPKLGVEIGVHGLPRVLIGVDGVGAIEEASVRSIGPLLAAAGPYSGAVLRSDGSLCLALDGVALAARARSLGA
jgi:two-component system chemotaxis sensor kinase CheA